MTKPVKQMPEKVQMTIAELKDRFEEYLTALAIGEREPRSMYRPMQYMLDIGGKRIRPMLLMLSCRAITGGEIPPNAFDTAAAVEIFHNFTLVHDDIMDHADLRRGNETVHVKWDLNTAILSGDALFVLSNALLAENDPDSTAARVKEFNRVSMLVCEGQMEDLELADAEHASVPAYLEMIRKKTAALLGGSMSLGAICARAGEEVVKAFYELGETAGLAFQLQDDYLDAFADQSQLGKKVGGDILENKKTYLYLKCMEHAGADAGKLRSELAKREGEDKIAFALKAFEDTGAKAGTEVEIANWFGKAEEKLSHLNTLYNMEDVKSILTALTQRKF